MTITTFQMLWNEIDLLVIQVLPSHRAKSHEFFDAHGGICSANVFPFSIIRINLISHKSKNTSSERKILFANFYSKFGISITRF